MVWFISKLEYQNLPSKDIFWNDLTNTQIDDEDYEQAVWIWNKFECKTFRDYHDIYLESDVAISRYFPRV